MSETTDDAEVKAGAGSDDDYVYPSKAGEIRLPPLSKVPRTFAAMEAIVDDDEDRLAVLLLREAASAETLELLRKLDGDDYDKMLSGWVDWSGVTPGESEAS